MLSPETVDILLTKLDTAYEAATYYLEQGKPLSFEFWATQYHSTANTLLACTGIEHRNCYA